MITKKITSKNAMSIGQRKAIKRLFEDTFAALNLDSLLDSLNVSKENAQEIIENGNILPTRIGGTIIEFLKRNSIIYKRFGPAIKEFVITIPINYNHGKQIDDFFEREQKKKSTYYYNDNLISSNFAKATNKLEPGKAYNVKIIPILSTVTSDDCMTILKEKNAILVGGQGLTLVYDLAKENLPKGKWVLSLDEKDALWKDAYGKHRIPFIFSIANGDYNFDLCSFESYWINDYFLLCVCNEDL